ncbi:hypothetical protein B0J14DRAFT_273823 [Halenospora varia]|nr:hypothetical protein B0J14DRAFT_273823 [Halenospora varia]
MKNSTYSCLLFLPFLLVPAFAQTCYTPDGSFLPGTFRCDNSTSGHSTCCELGTKCWSNNVCEKLDKGITDWVRMGCTDPTFKDPACLNQCLDLPKISVGIRPCDGISGTKYCCDYVANDAGNLSCCAATTGIFSLPSATIKATIPLSQVSSTSRKSTSTSVTTSGTGTTTSATGVATPATTTSASPASTSALVVVSDSSLSTGAKAGLGVGVGLGAVLAVVGIGALYMAKRKRRADYKMELPGSSPMGPPKGMKYNGELDANGDRHYELGGGNATYAKPPMQQQQGQVFELMDTRQKP